MFKDLFNSRIKTQDVTQKRRVEKKKKKKKKISKIGDGSNLISDSYAAIFFVTGNHNKTENEILSFRTL
jgi:UDP-N-acetylenolpyruvoylglucosamine reductase